ncbi:MAG: hypothetical protein COA79_08095 [Planctomycetota bacterium]|nr:MAG: hypothetical protein COA79_08095 [Planctomycetota bacterium]
MKRKFLDWPFLIFLFFAIIGPVGTKVYGIYNHILYLPPFTWMDTQPKINPQEASDLFKDGRGMQEPVADTVSRIGINTHIINSFSSQDLSSYFSNPLEPTKEVFSRGQKDFKTYCTPCHGEIGDGGNTGTLRGGHFAPPSLHSGKLKKATDGFIYQIIIRGQNTMPSYAKQIPVENRWAIIHYIRALQRAKDANVKDLDRVEKKSDKKEVEKKSTEDHH